MRENVNSMRSTAYSAHTDSCTRSDGDPVEIRWRPGITARANSRQYHFSSEALVGQANRSSSSFGESGDEDLCCFYRITPRSKPHKALDEVKEAQRLTEEANENLMEALVAQKQAEENSEIEKFRIVEMEQAVIEAAQKKEEEWQEELVAVKENKESLWMSFFLSHIQLVPLYAEYLAKKAQQKAEQVAKKMVSGYSNDSNPFGDSNLNEKFVWRKKIKHDISESVTLDKFSIKAEKKRPRERLIYVTLFIWNLSRPVDRPLMQVLHDSPGVVIKVIHKSINGLDDSSGLVIKLSQSPRKQTTPSTSMLQLNKLFNTPVEESHLFYLKAIKKYGHTYQRKYDIIFMIEPSATIENVQEVNHPEHLSSTSLISVPHPLPPPAKQMLFEVPSTSISNKRLTEDNHLHCTASNSILALSSSATQAIKSKENSPATT
ncbi:Cactin (ISS) [Forsythia ovata]|uniref:Cactin (ISS) n=1 Tax=Forsythia ovata TaxID=205694 RepID=A0ABD1WLE3_9LAMI